MVRAAFTAIRTLDSYPRKEASMNKNGFLASVALLGLGLMSTSASAAVFDINGNPASMPGDGVAIT
jgi:hypothetical protein